MNRKYVVLVILNIFLINNFVFAAKDDVLITIGDKEITKTEFLRIYEKNNENAFDPKSIEEYLDLFVNFKLKVLEAEGLGLDETESFNQELNQYIEQLQKPYLTSDDKDTLYREAYERAKQEINASHILIRMDPNASPEDTTFAYKKAMQIRKRILSGESFESVARGTSDDPSVKRNGGNLGYFTVFQMIYPFESAAYRLDEGEISMPVRTRFGYHIIKVHDKRPARGQVKVAHIMKAFPQNAPEDSVERAKQEIQEIEQKLNSGGDFAELARKYSDDKRSGRNGGELPWFGTGQMVPAFEDAAFSLDEKGAVSDVIRTNFGFHILKLIDRKRLEPYEDFKSNAKQKVEQGARAEKSKEMFIAQLKEEYDFKEDSHFVDSLSGMIDRSIYSEQWSPGFNVQQYDSVLFSFDDKQFLEKDFINYLMNEAKKPEEPMPVIVYLNRQYKKFVDDILYEYERSILPEKYPEYSHLVEEYHDGILLFELTDSMVWSKAMKDTAGLEAFYNRNKQDYMWGERVKVSVFHCDNEDIARKTRKYAKRLFSGFWFWYTKDKVLEKVNTDTTKLVSLETRLFSEGENETIDSMEWEKQLSRVVKGQNEEDGYKIYLIEEVVPPQPKKLQEARGIIIADYQDYLEEKWIEELRNKYEITINQEALNDLKAMAENNNQI